MRIGIVDDAVLDVGHAALPDLCAILAQRNCQPQDRAQRPQSGSISGTACRMRSRPMLRSPISSRPIRPRRTTSQLIARYPMASAPTARAPSANAPSATADGALWCRSSDDRDMNAPGYFLATVHASIVLG